MSSPRIGAVILAAGQGTRLKSQHPKVLHEVCGRPMLAYVLDACRAAGITECIVVVGHRKEEVVAAFADDGHIRWVEQNPQRGTGHAVMVCRQEIAGRFDHLVVLCGDAPLVRTETIRAMLDVHLAEGAAATLATAIFDDPAGYGRIWRDADGKLLGIVEHRDCTPAQLEIREINPGYYAFKLPEFLGALDQLTPNNAKNEYYITDTIAHLLAAGHKAMAVTSVAPEDVFGINSRQHLALVNRVMRDRILDRLMSDGVTIVDPASTWIDGRATVGADTVIHPHVCVEGPACIGPGCVVGPFAVVRGPVTLAERSVVPPFSGGRA
ncbi:MAG: NTP transferase domain-containing protein [Phycisphaerae bacterium]|jgi:bifunctional UDP-N-acetylglucosamine pyrophosphorylase/glucosamine-1-phosphate N-acetyltransferase